MTDVRTWVETVEEVLTAIKDRDHQIEELRSRLERTRDRQASVKDQRIRKIQKYKREIVKIARALGIQGPAEVDEYCVQIRRKARDLHTETQELRAKLEETRLEMRTGRATKFIDNSDLLLALKARDAGRDQQIKQLRAELEEERAKGAALTREVLELRNASAWLSSDGTPTDSLVSAPTCTHEWTQEKYEVVSSRVCTLCNENEVETQLATLTRERDAALARVKEILRDTTQAWNDHLKVCSEASAIAEIYSLENMVKHEHSERMRLDGLRADLGMSETANHETGGD